MRSVFPWIGVGILSRKVGPLSSCYPSAGRPNPSNYFHKVLTFLTSAHLLYLDSTWQHSVHSKRSLVLIKGDLFILVHDLSRY